MKLILVLFISILFSGCFGGYYVQPTQSLFKTKKYVSSYVWCYGRYYHKSRTCKVIQFSSARAFRLYDAINKGYAPCPICGN